MINCNAEEVISLQIPSWRPGRYEIANYAQKIKEFEVYFEGKSIPFEKKNKDLWQFQSGLAGNYEINYVFHAAQMDAGGSWSDEQQLYLNFINFIFEVLGRSEEKVILTTPMEENDLVATSLPSAGRGKWEAINFQHLVDSPLIISPFLKEYLYKVEDIKFHLWFLGELHFDPERLLKQFEAFTRKQMASFGSFPASDYHFMIQLLPFSHYHGVEHQFSTVITLGPAESLAEKQGLYKLLGVSSHELYHFWNVCRIRPKEMLPYDFSKEAYFHSGVVAEGITTYMGDLFLISSGCWDLEEYLEVLSRKITLEANQFGWQNQSIAESSFDLWLDGYKAGIPEKKVSIYNRGALIALCLDLMLIEEKSSLHAVMKTMWEVYGNLQLGYDLNDFENIVKNSSKHPQVIRRFFEDYIWGKEDLLPLLTQQLDSIGITLNEAPAETLMASSLGIKINEHGAVIQIHPKAAAHKILMIGDELIHINGESFQKGFSEEGNKVNLTFKRWERILSTNLNLAESPLYKSYTLKAGTENSKRKLWCN